MFCVKTLLFCILFLITTNQVLPQSQSDYESVAPKAYERCIVCDVQLTPDDVVLVVKGRRVPLNQTMVDSFLSNQAKYFQKLQPKGALFQENMEARAGSAQGGISSGWFVFGTFVLIALISGGLSGYTAVAKGLPALPNFFIGFFLSVLGFIFVATRPSAVKKGEIPDGLVKVPTTHTPVDCPKCGSENHPSAEKCSGCGEGLNPLVESEVTRT